jgi:hypothetical protein
MSHCKPHVRPKAPAGRRDGVVTDSHPAHDVPLEPEHDPRPAVDPDPDRKDGERVVFNEGNRPG